MTITEVLKSALLCITLLLFQNRSFTQQTVSAKKDFTTPQATEVWKPEPAFVAASNNDAPPSDALILFDGTSLNQWRMKDGSPAGWILKDRLLTIDTRKGDLYSTQLFGDCQLHIEFNIPTDSIQRGRGTNAGNSGVFIQERYEVQIFDSHRNQTPLYANGQTGSIYKQAIPMVNAQRGNGEWNRFDIFYTAPLFNENGSVRTPAFVTVVLNGVLTLNHFAIQGSSTYIGIPRYEPHGKASIRLQSHGSAVSFRNIWVRELK